MARERPFIFAMNGGEVSALSLGRVDLQRMRITAEICVNAIPKVIGPMSFRPGFGYQGATRNSAVGRHLPFIFSATDTALVELTDMAMRVIVAGVPISRLAVSTTVTNGDFSSATGWTTTTTGGGVATIASGVLTMNTLVRGSTALCRRSVTVAGGDVNKEHALKIVVSKGPVRFRCGSTAGGDEYIRESVLNTGTYSLAFTPTGTFHVQFSCESEPNRIVDSIQVEAAGDMVLTTPWPAASLNQVRYVQSGDVIFGAHSSGLYQTQRIERRGARSWGVALHELEDGPYRGKTAGVKLTASAVTGNGTLTASAPFFRADHVGCLFELTHLKTTVINSLSAEDRYTDFVRVVGVRRVDQNNDGTGEATSERQVNVTISGFWSGRISYMTSLDDGESYTDFRSDTSNRTNDPFHIGADNSVTQFRLGFLPGEYTSGVAVVTLTYNGGGGRGVVRITGVTDSQTATYEVVSRLYSTGAATDWQEGLFSAVNGWPTSVDLFEGRLWLGSQDKINGTVSDNFVSYNLDTEGDSGPIMRSVANGPVNGIRWILGLARLAIGTAGAEPIARSSSFDEPMTPTNFSIKDASTQGSADIQAVKVDRSGVFVQRSGKRLYILRFSVEDQDYISEELTRYHPTVLDAGVVGVAVQRQPDTRIWCWLTDGTAVCLVYEPREDVIAFCRVETDGDIVDVVTLPNVTQDDVTFIIKRQIDGSPVYYREQLAYDDNAQGGADNYMADSYVTATLAAESTMSGLDHLVGEDVVAWVAGSPMLDDAGDPMTFTVDAGGEIALGEAFTGTAIAGLPYEGRWKSTKLAYGAQMGTAVSQRKRIADFAPLLYKTHTRGLKYGRDFSKLTFMPRVIGGKDRGLNHFLDSYDCDPQTFPGDWDTDSRVCLLMRAPLPCTVLGFSGAIETHDKP